MMILRSSPSSPFIRKVQIAASILGFDKDIVLQGTNLNDEADPICKQNPLGKIPVLILEDGTAYYDSRVILEYLDYLAGGGRIIPNEPKARFESLRLQALCDGLLDASILIVYETRYRAPEMRVQAWVDRQMSKISRGLALLETAPPMLDSTPNVGQIALACALGYLDLRFEGKWRKQFPRLLEWHDAFDSRVPAFISTKPVG